MNKDDLDELLNSLSYSGMSPERLAVLKDKVKKKPAIALALERAKRVREAEQLFEDRTSENK